MTVMCMQLLYLRALRSGSPPPKCHAFPVVVTLCTRKLTKQVKVSQVCWKHWAVLVADTM